MWRMASLLLLLLLRYGVLKSATSVFVLLLDLVIRRRLAPFPVQMAILVTTLGGLIAGIGDLSFNAAGYGLALASAGTTAAYMVTIGILGEDFKMDSSTMLLYNAMWSAPAAILVLIVNGEVQHIYATLAATSAAKGATCL